MPNYIMNKLQVDGDPEKVKELMLTIKGEWRIDFNKIVAMPDYIFRGDLGDEEEKLFGEDTWYEWSIKHWGTKWNAICKDDADKCTYDTIYFQTAWSGVPKLIYLLFGRYPDLKFIYEYADEDFGQNCGRYVLTKNYKEREKIIPENGSKQAFDLAQSLWDNPHYVWNEDIHKINYIEEE